MVVRDRQDDQLLGYTLSFETATRSNELEALVTGAEMISAADSNSIGTFKVASNLACTEPSNDPRFIIEAFYKMSRCISGANHVRVVLPMAQFKVTEVDREGTISFYRYTAETGISVANLLGDGPYGDFPADVAAFLAAREDDELTTGFDFEENIEIGGSCGTIPVGNVPAAACNPEADVTVDSITFPDDFEILISGSGFDDVNAIQAVIDGTPSWVWWSPASGNPSSNGDVVSWSDTAIHVSVNPGQVDSWFLSEMRLYCVITEPQSINTLATYEVDEDIPTSDPEFFAVTSGSCENVDIDGSFLHQVDHIEVLGTFGTLDFYDPSGPNNGLNDPLTEISNWDANSVQFTNPALVGETVESIHSYGEGDVPDYGAFDFDDFDPAVCLCDPDAEVVVDSITSPDDYEVLITGSGFNDVTILELINAETETTPGAVSFYIYRPDYNLTSNIIQWDDTTIHFSVPPTPENTSWNYNPTNFICTEGENGYETIYISEIAYTIQTPGPPTIGWHEMSAVADEAIDEPAQVVIDNAGRYLVVGTSNVGGSEKATVARFTATGVLDTTFGTDGFARNNYVFGPDQGLGIVVYPDDSVLVLGTGENVGNVPQAVLTKFTAAGALDPSWNSGNGELSIGAGSAVPRAIFREPADGRIVVAWEDSSSPGDTMVSRINALGTATDGLVVLPDFAATTMARGQAANGSFVLAGTNAAGAANRAAYATFGIGGTVTDISSHGFVVPPKAIVQRPGTDQVYLVGESSTDTLRLARYAGGAWAFDPAFNSGAPLDVSLPAWTFVQAADVVVYAGGPENVVITGWSDPGSKWVVAVVDPSGALVPSYDTDGIAEYTVGTEDNTRLVDSLLEEAEQRITHIGVSWSGAADHTVIGRTLLFGSDSLDPDFSPT